MRTNYHKIILVILVAGSLTACNKQLDLAPEGTLTEKAALKDSGNTAALVAGAYLSLWTASNSDVYLLGDLTTGIAMNYSPRYFTGAIDSRDGTIAGFWNNNYATINLANVCITKLANQATFSSALQKRYIAEAKFIRAFSYLNLLKLFGDGALQGKANNMGVPLRLQSFDGYDGSQNIPRSTNGLVYAQILQDLSEAIPDLPSGYPDDLTQRTHATKGSASALAARAALYMGNYDLCSSYCDAVLNDNLYTLLPSILSVFPNNVAGAGSYPFNQEIVFAFPVSYNQDPTQYALNNTWYFQGFTNASDSFRATYQAGDIRNADMFDTVNVYGSPHIMPRKFTDPNDKDNLVIFRIPEIMLDKAEALVAKNGVNQPSIDLLNQIHQRSFPPGQAPMPYTMANFSSPQVLTDQLLQEREWELAFEGQDRYDRIRLSKQPNGVLPANRYVFPIPQPEIDITGGLIKQNPGY
ncbi:RagB/SusD family nutrient uptake outer membrane protein [Flavitalea flava]